MPCRVIFVGKPGIGAALDNTVLCVSFMQHKGLTNIGIIYNKIPLVETCFKDNSSAAIAQWFSDSVDEKTLLDWLGLKFDK